ncbi:putative Kynurenine--oxoglutarate transaminase 1 protein, partial [Naja naja]
VQSSLDSQLALSWPAFDSWSVENNSVKKWPRQFRLGGWKAWTRISVNLGQGFPNFSPPDFVKKAYVEAISGENTMLHQYTQAFGHPRLVEILARFFGKLLQQDLDPLKNVMVTVIIIEPYFDCYEPMTRMAGGKPVFVPLHLKVAKSQKLASSQDWQLDLAELRQRSPNEQNRVEMAQIAELCVRHDVVCLSDEVYEWLVYDGNEHVKIGRLGHRARSPFEAPKNRSPKFDLPLCHSGSAARRASAETGPAGGQPGLGGHETHRPRGHLLPDSRPLHIYPSQKKNCDHFLRFCFAKEDSTLKAAGDILKEWSQERQNQVYEAPGQLVFPRSQQDDGRGLPFSPVVMPLCVKEHPHLWRC